MKTAAKPGWKAFVRGENGSDDIKRLAEASRPGLRVYFSLYILSLSMVKRNAASRGARS